MAAAAHAQPAAPPAAAAPTVGTALERAQAELSAAGEAQALAECEEMIRQAPESAQPAFFCYAKRRAFRIAKSRKGYVRY